MTNKNLLSQSHSKGEKFAQHFLQYVNKTGSPYHSVSALVDLLKENNFKFIPEITPWNLSKGGKYYTVRNFSTIFAFVVGQNFNPDKSRFCIVGTHTDSPCLRLRSKCTIEKSHHQQLIVECYGGGLWHTWFDRGLGIAGKLILSKPDGKGLKEELIRIDEPVAIIPNLAIHLQTSAEREAFKINKESHLNPVFCTRSNLSDKSITNESIEGTIKSTESEDAKTNDATSSFLNEIISIKFPDYPKLVDFDICLMDANPSCLSGFYKDFIESPRLDNLACTFATFSALIDSADDGEQNDISIAVAFDHEEVGSGSYVGAESSALSTWLTRIASSLKFTDELNQIYSRSLIISADMSHGSHPNYPEKHQKQHEVFLNKGITLKRNANQHYSSNPIGTSLCKMILEKKGLPFQEYNSRNDAPCGSTIGPIISSALGMRSIDIGIAQWAMHSCRETCGVDDLHQLYQFLIGFYQLFGIIDTNSVYMDTE